ncbi:hypothetical protein ERJ75_001509800 [Trypanosoma vivax]|nr:hypothetical protein ERJ75_001509800 [Trypanosoma vivax]
MTGTVQRRHERRANEDGGGSARKREATRAAPEEVNFECVARETGEKVLSALASQARGPWGSGGRGAKKSARQKRILGVGHTGRNRRNARDALVISNGDGDKACERARTSDMPNEKNERLEEGTCGERLEDDRNNGRGGAAMGGEGSAQRYEQWLTGWGAHRWRRKSEGDARWGATGHKRHQQGSVRSHSGDIFGVEAGRGCLQQ